MNSNAIYQALYASTADWALGDAQKREELFDLERAERRLHELYDHRASGGVESSNSYSKLLELLPDGQ